MKNLTEAVGISLLLCGCLTSLPVPIFAKKYFRVQYEGFAQHEGQKVKNAINVWNSALKFEYFVFVSKGGDVVISETSHGFDNNNALTRYEEVHGFPTIIRIKPNLVDSSLSKAICRNLGYVIGLRNTESTSSLMFNNFDEAQISPTQEDIMRAKSLLGL